MKFKKLTAWTQELESLGINDKNILSWMNESDSITSRIKSFSDFKLELLNDGPGEINIIEDDLIISNYEKNNIREVILYSNNKPLIYAKSIIPKDTIIFGLKILGNLKENPLGDILFSHPNIKKRYMLFAKFKSEHGLFCGRKGIYTVNDYPFSVCEIFLINAS